jgi:ribosome-interacting GTPase 1
MLVATTTGAPVKVAPYPYTTVALAPGMWRWEDVQIQLVDAPPMTPDHVPPGLLGAIRFADAAVIVVDAAGDCLEEVESVFRILAERGVQPVSISRLKLRQAREQKEELSLSPLPADDATAEADAQAGKLQPIPALIAANKTDVAGAADNVPVLREIYSDKIEIYPVSAETGEGLGALGKRLWELLALIRIYTKEPGKPVDKERPYTLPIGANVEDLCRLIHRELPEKFKFARIWGDGRFEGAQVHKGEVLRDKDIVEIHS